MAFSFLARQEARIGPLRHAKRIESRVVPGASAKGHLSSNPRDDVEAHAAQVVNTRRRFRYGMVSSQQSARMTAWVDAGGSETALRRVGQSLAGLSFPPPLPCALGLAVGAAGFDVSAQRSPTEQVDVGFSGMLAGGGLLLRQDISNQAPFGALLFSIRLIFPATPLRCHASELSCKNHSKRRSACRPSIACKMIQNVHFHHAAARTPARLQFLLRLG